MHPYECANCHRWYEGAAYFASDAPRDRYGRVERPYLDSKPPKYCTEQCRAEREEVPA